MVGQGLADLQTRHPSSREIYHCMAFDYHSAFLSPSKPIRISSERGSIVINRVPFSDRNHDYQSRESSHL